MKNITINDEKLKNIESPFTELFSLLKRYESSSGESTTLPYASDDLKILYQHIDNAMDVLLRGLQGISQLMGITSPDQKILEEMNQLNFFISAIANLTEALNDLRSDTDYVLRMRGISNY